MQEIGKKKIEEDKSQQIQQPNNFSYHIVI